MDEITQSLMKAKARTLPAVGDLTRFTQLVVKYRNS